MPIVASVVIEDSRQADGRRWIREHHTDQLGVVYERAYMALAGDVIDVNAPVAALNQQLVNAEIRRNLAQIYAKGPLAVVTSDYATLADIRAGLRAAYLTAKREQAFALGAFLDTLTNGQLATLFNIGNPSAELTALRNRLATKSTQWTGYIGAAGE